MTDSAKVSMVAVGDIQLHGAYHEAAQEGAAARLFAGLKELIGGVDVAIGNMETVLAHGGSPREDKLCLLGDPRYAHALRDAGLDLMTLANNHALDFGREGLEETLEHLSRAGIDSVGAGADLSAAMRPLVREHAGVKLGFIGACHESTKPVLASARGGAGAAPLAEETLWPAIDSLCAEVDHVILLLHWGLEYSHFPTPDQVTLAHAAVDRGVSLILGAHSHSLQGIERYKDAIIVYSLANLTDAPVDWQGPTRRYRCDVQEVDRESVLLRLSATRKHIQLDEIVPLWLADGGRPSAATGERADKILAAVDRYSARLQSDDLERYWQETVIDSRVTGPLTSWWRDGSLLDKIRNFRPGQLVTAWILLSTWLRIRFSRSESRWMLFSSRNDERPMPSASREAPSKPLPPPDR